MNMFAIGIVLFVVGVATFMMSDKERNLENNEWSSMLQWGYLLMLIGLFGVLANFMSFTAVLLIFLILTAVVWVKDKINRKSKNIDVLEGPSGHFVDYISGFFPIVLIVFIFRTFLFEPFVIPSSSMRPGLIPGDFVLVSKYSYGIRMPIINNILIPTKAVDRGDVAVFNYPKEPELNYIKRIIGIPGDVIVYKDKILTINGQEIPSKFLVTANYKQDSNSDNLIMVDRYAEQIGEHHFDVFKIASQSPLDLNQVNHVGGNHSCEYDASGFICTVPAGKYFAMGDNRDDSLDSRYWGFVDDKLMVGKANYIWMNFQDFGRIGTKIN